MKSTSYTAAREHLAELMDEVEDDRTVVRITRRGHEDVALIAASELDGLLETAHLLRSPKNARRLFEALARARAGEGEVTTPAALRAEIDRGARGRAR